MSKEVDIKGTLDLNGQTVAVGSNYNLAVAAGGSITNNAVGEATLTLSGDDSKLDVFGTLANNSGEKLVVNCNGGATAEGNAGVFLNAGSALSNGENAGGFEFNINGSGSYLSIEGDLDMASSSAAVNISSGATGTVLEVKQGGSITVGDLSLA